MIFALLAAAGLGSAQDKNIRDKAVLERINGEAEIAVSGDSRGHLIGTVSKNKGGIGLVGESVAIAGDSWNRSATAGENGFFFVVAVPLNARGKITIESAGRKLIVDASDLPLRLTARPTTRRLSLEGPWRILVDPPTNWQTASNWREIDVPSNWEMKGFRAASGTAVMRKEFRLPRNWKGKRVKLRAEGIYSKWEAWLNGVRIGSHDGGATPIEFDLTDVAKYGELNTLDVFIRARSRAADIDHMSVYAYFEIAGIWRPIEVFAVEPGHVARIDWSVEYDKDYKNADLTINATVANAQAAPVKDGKLSVRVLDPALHFVKTESRTISLGSWGKKPSRCRFISTTPSPGRPSALVSTDST